MLAARGRRRQDRAVTSDTMTSEHTPFHRSPDELVDGLAHVRESPRDAGRLELVVVRPTKFARRVLDEAVLDLELGVVGDSWIERGSSRMPDGGPNPEAQVTVMNARAVDLVAARHVSANAALL